LLNSSGGIGWGGFSKFRGEHRRYFLEGNREQGTELGNSTADYLGYNPALNRSRLRILLTLFTLNTDRILPALRTLKILPALPILKMLPALPILKILPALPILKILPALPMLKILR
jgi:hypothetical protein